MVRKSEQRERTHAEILRSAASVLRQRGIAAASVANVMGKLGLTVGGFYAHFPSKDALIAQALDEVMSESWQALIERHRSKPRHLQLGAIIDGYLSQSHRDAEDSGCPMPAIVSEMPAQDGSVRKAFRQGFSRNVQLLRDVGGIGEDEALAAVSLMVGALVLARATRGADLSESILAAARRAARRLVGGKS
ncbi:MAG TPA: TetR/AcrR family transcriptional regulator [Polyangiales bacterium]|nr:TetR/AcrR family transcriptional regulator [Polyangiales bacterium]